MMKFMIIIKISKQLFPEKLDDKINKKIIYYSKKGNNYYDKVEYSKDTIKISGNRSKIDESKNLLESKNSTFYYSLVKSLLYVYFNIDCFEVNSIKVFKNGNKVVAYSEDSIMQVFSEKKSLEINSEKLFGEKYISDTMMNALMNLTMSYKYKDLKFDYTWKCFNTLIRVIFNKHKDFDMLKELKEDLEENSKLYEKSIKFADEVDYNYLDKYFVNGMIYNNILRQGGVKSMIESVRSFNDKRVLCIFKKVLDYQKNKMEPKEYDNIKGYIDSEIKKKNKKNTDVIRFIILKYGYYLRCKFFHGEQIPANFLIFNANLLELDRITEPLQLVCVDLLEKKL